MRLKDPLQLSGRYGAVKTMSGERLRSCTTRVPEQREQEVMRPDEVIAKASTLHCRLIHHSLLTRRQRNHHLTWPRMLGRAEFHFELATDRSKIDTGETQR